VGVTPYGPVEANWGVRAPFRAAGKALEGDDRQTHKQTKRFYGNYRERPVAFAILYRVIIIIWASRNGQNCRMNRSELVMYRYIVEVCVDMKY